MIDLEQIKQLIAVFESSTLTSLSYEGITLVREPVRTKTVTQIPNLAGKKALDPFELTQEDKDDEELIFWSSGAGYPYSKDKQ